MAVIKWDAAGSRRFENGVSNGVLYLPDGTSVPWNGLTGVSENENRASKPFYLDGRKFLDAQTPGDFAATLKCFTYPDEFAQINGDNDVLPGLTLKDQPASWFNLSYQTRYGSDHDPDASGYKIHVLFQIMALPADKDFATLGSTTDPIEFSWTLSSTPSIVSGMRPTAHLVIDTGTLEPFVLAKALGILYGTQYVNPSLTDLQSFITALEAIVTIDITDNGDGTWTATGPDEYFSMPTDEEFQITDVDSTVIDSDTYAVTDTLISE